LIDLKRIAKHEKELVRRKAINGSFIDFAIYVNNSYRVHWHHALVAKRLEEFLKDPTKKCLAVFMPPQHGKSELTTRLFPAYSLGVNPDLKIAVCSYSSDLANSFNRDIQRYIDTDNYRAIFPETTINSKNVVTTQSWLRNSEIFEIVDKKGSLKSVGVGGGLSGLPVDLGIIDDPIKDQMEASSGVTRERIWQWYLSVFSTRLHNNSKQVLIMTRWHDDDLGGRLLNPKINPNYKDWEVVKLEAILEDKDTEEEDPREIGEALWEQRHSLDKLNKLRSLDSAIFTSLYQQNPTIKGGNKIKSDWFRIVDDYPRWLTKQLWIDSAFTEKKRNDPSGFMVTAFDDVDNVLYIIEAESKRMEMPSFLRHITALENRHNLLASNDTRIRIEPKASGLTAKQLINANTNLSAIDIKSYLVNESKESSAQIAAKYIEAGKVCLVKGQWNSDYIDQMIKFPNAKHDEYIDLTGYSCEYHFRESHSTFAGMTGSNNLF